MQSPIQITFRGMDHSDFVEAKIRERAAKLERFFDPILGCRVMVESGHRRHHKGNIYHVRIDVTVPGHELVVSRDPARHAGHEDVYVAVRDAFKAMRRQLEDHARRRRGHEKHHEMPPHGKVQSISIETGLGIIQSADGRELEFSRNSVVEGDFDRLAVGDEVRFAEAENAGAPAASTVRIVGKHHLVG